MTSSVYLDNVNLGLYHNRITKHPHSIAVRLRWYGTDPENGKVFVERKTHRDSWTGEESVKERFILPPQLVVPFLRGEHTWDDEEQRLRAESKIKAKKGGDPITNAQLDSIKKLFNEVQRAVESKQLQPMLRTVYMRTAFQVPYDASVRCSLDTSLAMVAENPKGGTSCQMSGRWYRDPELAIHRTEQTRFPHAVLEIKLALGAMAGAVVGHRPRQQRGADRGAQVFQIHARLRGALPGRGARGAVLGRRRLPATVDPVSGGRRDGGDATAQTAAAADRASRGRGACHTPPTPARLSPARSSPPPPREP